MSLAKNRPRRMPQDRRSAARQWFSDPRICRFFDYSDTLLAREAKIQPDTRRRIPIFTWFSPPTVFGGESFMNWLKKEEWPWWQAGLLLGLLNIAAFYTANYYLSVSTTFSRAAGMLVGLVAPEHVAANAYWQNVKPIVDWQFMLVLGIPIGAYLAARLSQKAVAFSGSLPDMWVSRFGTSNTQRWVVGILGGIFVGFSTRLADG